MESLGVVLVAVGAILIVAGAVWDISTRRRTAAAEAQSLDWLVTLVYKAFTMAFDSRVRPPKRLASLGMMLVWLGLLVFIVAKWGDKLVGG